MPSDVVHKIYENVLYFQNIIRFLSTHLNIILFKPCEKYGLPCTDFNETHKMSATLCREFLLRIPLKWDNKCGNCG